MKILRPGTRGPIPRPLEERFWPRAARRGPDECWPWQGRCTPGGYGRILVGSTVDGSRKMEGAHRVAWRLTFGSVPRGLGVLHHCDNPPCCNPAHLFLGTNTDNDRDRDEKGRCVPPPVLQGERNPRAKLTAEAVASIRVSREPRAVLARAFGIHVSQIGRIQRGIVWQHRA